MSMNRSFALLLPACAAVALTGCETVAEEATEAVGHEFVAMLSPTSGGPGSGKAEISLNDVTDMLCTDLELSQWGTMTSGHIMGPGNSVVADIDVPDDNDSDDCDNVTDAVIDSIRANPGAYSVHIESATGTLQGVLQRDPD